MMFNLDLTLIEKVLKEQELHVQSALVMPQVTKKPLQRDTVFVMLLGDNANDSEVMAGDDIEQYVTERIGIVIGVRSSGDSTGVQQKNTLKKMMDTIKQALSGLIIDNFDPIRFEAGQMVEVNRDTHNILYQLQFKTAQTVITQVKYYEER